MSTFFERIPKDSYLASLTVPPIGKKLSDQEAMQFALDYAYQGLGFVAPNPLVGCVILDAQGGFLAAGAHRIYGQEHAEIDALNNFAKLGDPEKLKGASVFVTLEPCAHVGRTPSCAKHLAGLPIRRVVYALKDPTPKVNGQGIEILKAANILCHFAAEFEEQAIKLVEVFLTNHNNHRPFIALKAALSLDGSIATRGDRRQFITGKRARAYGHFLRSSYDAIMIGAKTLVLDLPKLDARLSLFKSRPPLPIVFDPKAYALRQVNVSAVPFLKTLDDRTKSIRKNKALWIVAENTLSDDEWEAFTKALEKVGCQLVKSLPYHDRTNKETLAKDLFCKLYSDFGICSLLLEGGTSSYELALASGYLDRVFLFYSPQLLLGGERINLLDHTYHSSPIRFSQAEITVLDEDWLVSASLKLTLCNH